MVIRAYVRSRVETVEEVGLDCVVVLSGQQVVHALQLPVRDVTARATRKERAKHLDFSATTDLKTTTLRPRTHRSSCRARWCCALCCRARREFLVLRVDEIDPSQFSCVIEMELFIRPLLLLLQLGVLSH